jgi:DNA-binding phage protein
MAKKHQPPNNAPIGQQIRRLIEKHRGPGSIASVAVEAGMKPQQLDRIVNGHIKNPELATIHRILSVIGIHQCYGCGGTGKCPTCHGKGTV